DEGLQVILGEAGSGGFVDGGIGHRALLENRLSEEVSEQRAPRSRREPPHTQSSPVIHSRAQRAGDLPGRSVLMACFFERGLLRRRSFLLVLRLPFGKRHAVDRLAALVLAHGDA